MNTPGFGNFQYGLEQCKIICDKSNLFCPDTTLPIIVQNLVRACTNIIVISQYQEIFSWDV